ncbi:MAG: MFS transporter [bacterium]
MNQIIGRIIDFYRTGADKPLLEDKAQIARIYRRKRRIVFLSLVFGYSFFYVCRLTISVVKTPMFESGILNPDQMGKIGFALFLTYAFGKLINGFIGDRSNIRIFLSTGLLISAILNILFGFTNFFIFFVILWALNGWFQSMGCAPCIVSMAQWFSKKEIGTRYGLWSTAHSMGEGVTFVGTAMFVSYFGWRWGFWGAGGISIIVAILLFRLLADRPQTYCLPSVAVYRNDHDEDPSHTPISVGQAQIDVIKNPYVWILGISSACLYVARYGINSWGIPYLEASKGYSLVAAGSILGCGKVVETIGAISSGFISDFFFNSRRNIVALLYGLLLITGLFTLFLSPPGARMLHLLGISLFGFGLGGLLAFLGGLMAVDICSKRASGAAMGLVGVFSYLGAAIQDWVSGSLINASKTMVDGQAVYNYDYAFYLWLSAAICSVLLSLTLWNVKAKD